MYISDAWQKRKAPVVWEVDRFSNLGEGEVDLSEDNGQVERVVNTLVATMDVVARRYPSYSAIILLKNKNEKYVSLPRIRITRSCYKLDIILRYTREN